MQSLTSQFATRWWVHITCFSCEDFPPPIFNEAGWTICYWRISPWPCKAQISQVRLFLRDKLVVRVNAVHQTDFLNSCSCTRAREWFTRKLEGNFSFWKIMSQCLLRLFKSDMSRYDYVYTFVLASLLLLVGCFDHTFCLDCLIYLCICQKHEEFSGQNRYSNMSCNCIPRTIFVSIRTHFIRKYKRVSWYFYREFMPSMWFTLYVSWDHKWLQLYACLCVSNLNPHAATWRWRVFECQVPLQLYLFVFGIRDNPQARENWIVSERSLRSTYITRVCSTNTPHRA